MSKMEQVEAAFDKLKKDTPTMEYIYKVGISSLPSLCLFPSLILSFFLYWIIPLWTCLADGAGDWQNGWWKQERSERRHQTAQERSIEIFICCIFVHTLQIVLKNICHLFIHLFAHFRVWHRKTWFFLWLTHWD